MKHMPQGVSGQCIVLGNRKAKSVIFLNNYCRNVIFILKHDLSAAELFLAFLTSKGLLQIYPEFHVLVVPFKVWPPSI